jgi:hypothetical protein
MKHIAEYNKTAIEAPTAPLGMPPVIGIHEKETLELDSAQDMRCCFFVSTIFHPRTSHADIRQKEGGNNGSKEKGKGSPSWYMASSEP